MPTKKTPWRAFAAVVCLGNSLAGCATTVDSVRLGQVKRAAVVTFTSSLDPTHETNDMKHLLIDVRGPREHMDDLTDQLVENREVLEVFYELLQGCLSDELGWDFVDIESVRKNETYSSMRGEVNRYVPAIVLQTTTIPAVISNHFAPQLDDDRWAALAKSLDVDALLLVSLSIDTAFGGISSGGKGIGTHRPFMVVNLEALAADGSTVMWRERGARGDPSVQGYGEVLGHYEGKPKKPLLREAFDNVCRELIERKRAAEKP